MQQLILTNDGQEMLTNVLSNGGTITFTTAVSSDTEIEITEISTLKQLTSIQQTVIICNVSKYNHAVTEINITFDGENIQQGYYIKTVGINATDGINTVLFAVAIEDNNVFVNGSTSIVPTKANYKLHLSFTNSNIVSTISNEYASTEQLNERIRNRGNYDIGMLYSKNDIFTYNNVKYIVTNGFVSEETPDQSKIEILGGENNDGYDHFLITIDMSDVNPSKENGTIVYGGGCENFTLSDWENWFGYKPVIVKKDANGNDFTIVKYLDKNNYAQDTEGTDVSALISTVDKTNFYNVMIKFPRRGYKIFYDYDNKKAYLYITNNPNDRNYSYYAFDDVKRRCSNLYVGVYDNTIVSSNGSFSLKYTFSLSTNSSATMQGISLDKAYEYARNVTKRSAIFGFLELNYFQIMYIIHFGKINGHLFNNSGNDCICGCGNTAGLNSEITNYKAYKMFGIEFNQSCYNWINGVKLDSSGNLIVNEENTGYVGGKESGYIGNDITWDEFCGIQPYSLDSTSNKYFHATHKSMVGKNMLIYCNNIFHTIMDQVSSYVDGTELSSRMMYKR